VFFTLSPFSVGSWIPTLMGNFAAAADSRSPRTKEEVVMGWQREIVSVREGAI
jgi:hypothetical protein